MRAWLVIGGIVAIAAGIALWLLVRSNDDASAQSAPPPAPRERVNPGTAASDRPMLPRDRTERGSASRAGDAVVRDHRTGDHLVRSSPPIDRQQRTRLLPVALTKEITSQVNAMIAACTTAFPAGTAGVRLDGDVTVAIVNHKLTVTAASVATPGATGLDGAKQCIEERSVGLSIPADRQEDIADYKIAVSFRLP
jgi:hypothetical protein